jgi:VWFA-related protein
VRALRPGDRASVVSFGLSMRFDEGLTDNLDRVTATIDGLSAAGSTSFYTTLYVVLRQVAASRPEPGVVRRPVVVVLTDGEDNASAVTSDDLIDQVRRAGVAVYPISIAASRADPEAGHRQQRETRVLSDHEYTLKAIARESGGMAYFPAHLPDLESVYGQVAAEVSAQYSLAYVPPSAPPRGSFRRLLVRVVSRVDVRPRTRAGYTAWQ